MASRLLRLGANLRPVANRFKSTHAADYKAAVASIPPTELNVLDNGVRVAVEESGASTATVGIWLDAGSRYEDSKSNGTGNFLEHLHLKGTLKRSQAELENEIESLGARLSASTGREQSAIWATCLAKDVPKVVEIVSDILQNPRLDEAEIERARNNVLRELQEAQQNLSAVVWDYLHATAYQGTPLGNSIFGPTKNIQSINKSALQNYADTHYKACRTVLVGAGGVDAKELVSLGEKNLGKLDNTFDGKPPVLTRCRFTASEVRVRDDSIPLAHIAFAVEGPGAKSPDNVALTVASQILGSWDRTQNAGTNNSNRLAAALAEGGHAHSYQTFNTAYSDTGLFGVYYVCDPLQCAPAIEHIQLHLIRLCFDVTENDVDRAKIALKAEIARSLDGPAGVAADIGRQLITKGHRDSLEEAFGQIDRVTAQRVRDVAREYIYARDPAVAAIGPVENLHDFSRICIAQKWWSV